MDENKDVNLDTMSFEHFSMWTVNSLKNSFVNCLTLCNNDWLDLNKVWITTSFFYSHVQCCNDNKQWMYIFSTSLLYATR